MSLFLHVARFPALAHVGLSAYCGLASQPVE